MSSKKDNLTPKQLQEIIETLIEAYQESGERVIKGYTVIGPDDDDETIQRKLADLKRQVDSEEDLH